MTAPVSDVITAIWPNAGDLTWSWSPTTSLQRNVVAPDRAEARHIIPWHPAAVVAATRRASDDRPRRQQLRDGVLTAGLLTVGSLRDGRRIACAGPSLIDVVAEAIGATRSRGIVISGPPRANRKPVVQLYDRRGRTVAFVKVAFNSLTTRLLDDETRALERLAGVADRAFDVPPVLGRGTCGEAHWLAIGPLGVDRRTPPTQTSVDQLAKQVERTAPSWSGAPADAPFVTRVRSAALGLPIAGPLVDAIADRHAAIELTTAAAHGDFVPWNILTGTPRTAVWDWERYTDDSPVGFDRFHHRIQVRVHRSGMTMGDAVRSVMAELDVVVPELAAGSRAAHLDWYLATMLCRYERDAAEVPTAQLNTLIADLSAYMKERHLP